jgi:hypothetical protein
MLHGLNRVPRMAACGTCGNREALAQKGAYDAQNAHRRSHEIAEDASANRENGLVGRTADRLGVCLIAVSRAGSLKAALRRETPPKGGVHLLLRPESASENRRVSAVGSRAARGAHGWATSCGTRMEPTPSAGARTSPLCA